MSDQDSSANEDDKNGGEDRSDEEINEEFQGDDSNDDENQDGDDEILTQIDLDNPLSLLDPAANLDAVLAARSIGDAIQILSPNLPGLPSKVRGKYRKRRLLSSEEKTKMMKDQNRENARRTRRRKKLYDLFLTKVIKALEEAIQSDDVQDLNTTSIEQNIFKSSTLKKSMKTSFNPSLACNESPTTIMQERLECLRRYLVMRMSSGVPKEVWLTVCNEDITLTMPIPSYRKISVKGTANRETYECQGLEAVIEDTENRYLFLNSMIIARGNSNVHLSAELDMHLNTAHFGSDNFSLSISFDYYAYEVPDSVGDHECTSSNSVKILKVPFLTNVTFTSEGLLRTVHDQFDVAEIEKQFATTTMGSSIRSVSIKQGVPYDGMSGIKCFYHNNDVVYDHEIGKGVAHYRQKMYRNATNAVSLSYPNKSQEISPSTFTDANSYLSSLSRTSQDDKGRNQRFKISGEFQQQQYPMSFESGLGGRFESSSSYHHHPSSNSSGRRMIIIPEYSSTLRPTRPSPYPMSPSLSATTEGSGWSREYAQQRGQEMLQKLLLSQHQLSPAASFEFTMPQYQLNTTEKQQHQKQQQQQQQQHNDNGSSFSIKSQRIPFTSSFSTFFPLYPHQETGNTTRQPSQNPPHGVSMQSMSGSMSQQEQPSFLKVASVSGMRFGSSGGGERQRLMSPEYQSYPSRDATDPNNGHCHQSYTNTTGSSYTPQFLVNTNNHPYQNTTNRNDNMKKKSSSVSNYEYSHLPGPGYPYTTTTTTTTMGNNNNHYDNNNSESSIYQSRMNNHVDNFPL